MTRSRQKQIERTILNMHLSALRVASGNIVESETPDFLVQVGPRLIGVEIVEYNTSESVGGHTKRAIEQSWKQLRTFAYKDETNRSKYRPYFVHVWFFATLPPRGRFGDFLAAVHSLVDANSAALSDKKWHEFKHDELTGILQTYCLSIRIQKIDAYAMWDSNLSIGWVGTSEDELTAIVSPKLSKTYKPCDELHLAILADGGSIATYIGGVSSSELTEYERLNLALAESRFAVLSILNGDETRIWERGSGWR